ncbi:hypothetical protein F9B85_09395 [Heliorestis acidaminivorans]|uniref:Uncharacterized protein n=1 Tax=Heliorestis acidaminivorans TaxID=553427 RepID=A0A6I0EYG4_9FIRM|nr:hypothetical protein [Heliorestis acidaminivorans]KAB2952360.1 hypothetical protein F9B85_09395 [Heliorestis acidaminivorans]
MKGSDESVTLIEDHLFTRPVVKELAEGYLSQPSVTITFEGRGKKLVFLKGDDGDYYRPLLADPFTYNGGGYHLSWSGEALTELLQEHFFTDFRDPQRILPLRAQLRPESQEGQLAQFIVNHLSNPQGGVFTNFRDDRPELADEARNHDILSESTGLWLEYAIWTEDEELYRQHVRYVRNYLMGPYGVLAWKVKRDNIEQQKASALIDDIRIAATLLQGYELWGDKRDLMLAQAILEGVYRYEQEAGQWAPWFDWSGAPDTWLGWFDSLGPNGGTVVPVRYLQPAYLAQLATIDERYAPLVEPTLDIIRQADLGNGLFTTDYSPDRGVFQDREAVNMIDSVLAALHGAQAGYVSTAKVKFLQTELTKGRIWAAYHRDQGEEPVAVSEFRSPAVYALAAQFFWTIGEYDWAQIAVDHLLLHRINDADSIFYGGFGDPRTGDCYSFDNLLALQALALVRKEQ